MCADSCKSGWGQNSASEFFGVFKWPELMVGCITFSRMVKHLFIILAATAAVVAQQVGFAPLALGSRLGVLGCSRILVRLSYLC